MSPIAFRHLVAAAAAVLVSGACATAPSAEVTWTPMVCYEGNGFIERVRAGRPDAADPNLQAVSVDKAGDVVLFRFADGTPRSEVIHRHGSELTGLLVSDVDPAIPGEEIYVGGYAAGTGSEGTGGEIVQIAVTPEGTRVRRVYAGDAYVHSLERVEPRAAADPVRIFFATYAGELRLLTPAPGAGPWGCRLLHREPANPDPEALKSKDAAFLADASGRPPHEAIVVLKTGRTLLIDLDRPEATRLVHEEKGGLSRVAADDDGGAFVTGYAGRVLHFVREGDGFRIDAVDHEGEDSGLRGIARGRFPTAGGTATLAIYGYHRRCRMLVPRLGGFDPVTVHVDAAKGHTLEAGDFLPGRGADEILLGGQSKQVVLLTSE